MTSSVKFSAIEGRAHQLYLVITESAAALWGVRTLVRRSIRRLARTVDPWCLRARGRRDLGRLDDHLLRDIGLSRSAAARG